MLITTASQQTPSYLAVVMLGAQASHIAFHCDATKWNSSPCPLLAPHVLDVTHQEGDHAAAAVSLSKLEIAAPKGSSGP